MPELPEVETVARGLAAHLPDTQATAVDIYQPKLRWPIPDNLARYLTHATFSEVSRRGKYLILTSSHGHLISHLGMSGAWYFAPNKSPLKKHDHLVIHLNSGQELRYHDPRRFGSVHWVAENPLAHPLLCRLGPEPLSPDFTAASFYDRCQKTSRPIKVVLMDPAVVVGVGNIYATEALFLARIHPKEPAKNLSLSDCDTLVSHSKQRLQIAIEQGGTTLRDFVNPDSKPGYFKQSLYVYAREKQPCQQCNTPIENIRLGQRSSFYCPSCQIFSQPCINPAAY